MKSAICVKSIIENIKPGSHLFSADFVSDNEGDRLEIKEFEFVKFVTGRNSSDININMDALPAEIFDIRFPKIHSKTDISYGFFLTKEDAAKSFVDMITHIYNVVTESYKKFVNLH
jgi:hypothetical protein